MQLLEPDQIRNEKKTNESIIQSRIKNLAEEELRLVLEVNLARENSKIEIDKITFDLESFIQNAKYEKDILVQQIKKLEGERNVLLQPIYEINERANAILAEAEKYKIDIGQQASAVVEDREKNKADADFNKKMKELLNTRESDIIIKEEFLNKKQVQIEESASKQLLEWDKLYKEKDEINKKMFEISQKDAELLTRENAIAIRQSEQNKRDEELKQHDRAIKDKYNSLQEARNEILGRTT